MASPHLECFRYCGPAITNFVTETFMEEKMTITTTRKIVEFIIFFLAFDFKILSTVIKYATTLQINKTTARVAKT